MTRACLPFLGETLLVILGSSSLVWAQDVTCYVDSVLGDDTKSGLSEAEAVQTQAKIPKTCTAVRFKRGSVFNEAVQISYTSKIKYFGNYGDPSLPLPKFEIPRSPNNGSMLSAYQGGITVDGLYLAGSQSDANMANLAKGICVMMGGNSKLINSEITDCDIGIMLTGTGTLVENNYVHDLHVSVDAAPGVDPNVVGGAEGIFVNGSNNEVAYNSFVNCSNYAEWTGGSCDGGATEVTVAGGGAELTGVKVHHNYSYNSCGFFEVSSGFSSDNVRGKFTNSEFYNNVTIDSGWLHLLQVANTDMHNIRWENNTLVQHKGSLNQGILMVVYTAVASGMSGGQLYEDSIYWTNNYFVADGVRFMNPDSRINQSGNLIIDTSKQDPGFVNLQGSSATDYDLVEGSPAINAGTLLPDRTLDFLNRAIPDPSGKPDVGAFEFGSTVVTPRPVPPDEGTPAPFPTGGSTGTTAPSAGTGGSTMLPVGGGGGAASVPRGTAGTTSSPKGSGGVTTGSGGQVVGSGGAGGTEETASSAPGAGGGGGESTGGSGDGGSTGAPTQSGASNGCSCRLGKADNGLVSWAGLSGLGLLLARRRGRPRRR